MREGERGRGSEVKKGGGARGSFAISAEEQRHSLVSNSRHCCCCFCYNMKCCSFLVVSFVLCLPFQCFFFLCLAAFFLTNSMHFLCHFPPPTFFCSHAKANFPLFPSHLSLLSVPLTAMSLCPPPRRLGAPLRSLAIFVLLAARLPFRTTQALMNFRNSSAKNAVWRGLSWNLTPPVV